MAARVAVGADESVREDAALQVATQLLFDVVRERGLYESRACARKVSR